MARYLDMKITSRVFSKTRLKHFQGKDNAMTDIIEHGKSQLGKCTTSLIAHQLIRSLWYYHKMELSHNYIKSYIEFAEDIYNRGYWQVAVPTENCRIRFR